MRDKGQERRYLQAFVTGYTRLRVRPTPAGPFNKHSATRSSSSSSSSRSIFPLFSFNNKNNNKIGPFDPVLTVRKPRECLDRCQIFYQN